MATAIKGMEAAKKDMQSLQAKVKLAKKKGEKRAADNIADDARVKAPGRLNEGIFVAQDDISTTIIGGEELAAYNEFGTGDFAAEYLSSMPVEMKEEAMKFYVNGQGKIPARPFFFPAIYRNQNKVVEYVNEELEKINKS
jgi:hypothetical protein